jgi:outer membrane protein assembly factor BamA
MNFYHRFRLALFLAVLSCSSLVAQNKDSLHRSKIIISSIKLEGNRRTKTSIILRELTFKTGDTIPASQWAETTLRSRNNILNTSLFNFVTFDTTAHSNGETELTIIVVERWYILPAPIFQLEERNFNVWWDQDHRSLNKIDYGFLISDNNSRGRKEILRIKLQLGYTQQWGVSYDMPYINKNQDFGLQFNFTSSQNKEIAYTSVGNILTFLNTPEIVLQQQYTSALDLTYRQGLYNIHYLELNFSACYINDTLLKLTKDYLPYNLTSTAFFGGKYYFKRDMRDRSFYPLEGYFFDGSINDYGFGVAIPKERAFNILYLQSSIHKYWGIANNLFYAVEVDGKVSLAGDQPYYLQRGLGYGNGFVRGYEYYVIDGNNYTLAKNEIKFRFLNVPVQQLPLFGFKQFDKAYYALYLTAFSDWGYVGDADPYVQNNFLANTPLWGYGAGIDLVAYYDVVLRFEYSFNKLNQHGFFLHFLADM